MCRWLNLICTLLLVTSVVNGGTPEANTLLSEMNSEADSPSLFSSADVGAGHEQVPLEVNGQSANKEKSKIDKEIGTFTREKFLSNRLYLENLIENDEEIKKKVLRADHVDYYDPGAVFRKIVINNRKFDFTNPFLPVLHLSSPNDKPDFYRFEVTYVISKGFFFTKNCFPILLDVSMSEGNSLKLNLMYYNKKEHLQSAHKPQTYQFYFKKDTLKNTKKPLLWIHCEGSMYKKKKRPQGSTNIFAMLQINKPTSNLNNFPYVNINHFFTSTVPEMSKKNADSVPRDHPSIFIKTFKVNGKEIDMQYFPDFWTPPAYDYQNLSNVDNIDNLVFEITPETTRRGESTFSVLALLHTRGKKTAEGREIYKCKGCLSYKFDKSTALSKEEQKAGGILELKFFYTVAYEYYILGFNVDMNGKTSWSVFVTMPSTEKNKNRKRRALS